MASALDMAPMIVISLKAGTISMDHSSESSRLISHVRGRELVDQLLDEQFDSWRRREPILIETFLEHHEFLRDQQELLLDLIDQEILLREEAGEQPSVEEYAKRFPKLADEIQVQFTVHQMMQLEPCNELLQTSHAEKPIDETLSSGQKTENAPLDFMPGRDQQSQLGPYKILATIGSGAMGTVYEAEDPLLKRAVALKVICPGLASDQTIRQRFLREAQAAAAIEHENIISIYQVGEEDGQLYIAMQRLQGETLEDRLKRERKLTVAETLRIGQEISCGLSAAHELGLLHRDIKPSNLWLERDTGRVRILDFGLSHASVGEENLTQSGVLLGTPAYMSPEQAESQKPTRKCDLFALGCVLYHALVGESPFARSGLLATLSAIAHDRIPTPHERCPEIPVDVSSAVMRLLERDPKLRPESAATVAEEMAMLRKEQEKQSSSELLQRRRHWWRVVPVGVLLVLSFFGFRFLPGLISIQTRDGVLYVETVDDTVQLIIEKEGGNVQLLDLHKKQKLHLQPGKYALHIQDDNGEFEIDTPKFTLTRDGRQVAHVNYRLHNEGVETPKQISDRSTSATEAKDADRRVAEWVLETGGTVQIQTSTNRRRRLNSQPVPQGPFSVVGITFGDNSSVNDEGLRRLQSLKQIQTLSLKHAPRVTDLGVTRLEKLTGLKRLGISSEKVTDRIWSSMSHLTSLEHLSLFGCVKLTGEGISQLKKLPSLSTLILEGTRISDRNLLTIESLPALQLLVLGTLGEDDPPTNAGVVHLIQAAPQLEGIDLVGGAVHRLDLPILIKECPKLKKLGCHVEQLAQLDWDHPETLPSLQTLEIYEGMPVRIQLDRLSHLKNLLWTRVHAYFDPGQTGKLPAWSHPGVQSVMISQSQINGGIGAFLKPFPNARTVVLYLAPAFVAEDVEVLASMTNLKELVLMDGCECVHPFLDGIRAKCPELRIHGPGLPAENVQQDPDRAAAVWVLKSGGEVGIQTSTNQTRTLNSLPLPAEPFSVVRVRFFGYSQQPDRRPSHSESQKAQSMDDGLRHLRSLKNIQELSFYEVPQLTDAGVAHLESLTSLEHLSLVGTSVTDGVWSSISHLTSLKHLNLFNCMNLEGEGITQLEKLKSLSTLGLRWVPIRNQNLLTFPSLPALTHLSLGGVGEKAQIDPPADDGFERVISAAPHLREIMLFGSAHRLDLSKLVRNCPHLEFLECHVRQLMQLNWDKPEKLPPLRFLIIDGGLPVNIKLDRLSKLERVQWNWVHSYFGNTGQHPPSVKWSHPGVQKVEILRSRLHNGIGEFLRPFPNVRVVYFCDIPEFAPEDVDILASNRKLTKLIIGRGCKSIHPFLKEIQLKRPDLQIVGDVIDSKTTDTIP